MKQIPHHLQCLPSILKNLSVSLSPHNPQQRETHDPPKSLTSNRVLKTLERNHQHIAKIV